MAIPLKDLVTMPVGIIETYILPENVSETDFLNTLRTYAFRRKAKVNYKRYLCTCLDDLITQRMVTVKIVKKGRSKRMKRGVKK